MQHAKNRVMTDRALAFPKIAYSCGSSLAVTVSLYPVPLNQISLLKMWKYLWIN